MLLPIKQVRGIAAGRTTQARILLGERHLARRKDADKRGKSATYWREPWTPVIGREVTVDGYRIAITAKKRAKAGDLTYQDAKAEGHGNIDNAKRAWVREHDAAWIDRHKVYLADALGPGVVDVILLNRFEERWTDEPVWIIGVELAAERPRFMARVTGTTSSPSMSIDPDAEVPGKEWTDKYARAAEAHKQHFYRDLEAERAKRKAERGRSLRAA